MARSARQAHTTSSLRWAAATPNRGTRRCAPDTGYPYDPRNPHTFFTRVRAHSQLCPLVTGRCGETADTSARVQGARLGRNSKPRTPAPRVGPAPAVA